MTSLKVGDKAPGFKLISTDKTEVNLSDYYGSNVLILFFPFAFTGVCTKELCSMRDDMARYESMKATVLGISVDSPYCLIKYKSELQLNFTLLSDFNKQASRAYDCIYEEFAMGLKGVSKRAAFIVDREGCLRYIEVLENAGNLPNFEAINNILTSIKE